MEKTKARLRKAFPELSEEEIDMLANHMLELAQLAIDAYMEDQRKRGKPGK